MITITRALVLATALLMVTVLPVYGLDYPTRPMRIVVGFAAGGPTTS